MNLTVRKFALIAAAFLIVAFYGTTYAYFTTTSVADNVNSIGATVGDTITGMTITYGSFTGADGTSVTAGSVTPTLTAGAFSQALTPNAGTSGVYTVVYTGRSGHTYAETWSVPVSTPTVSMTRCRTSGALLRRDDGITYLMPFYQAPVSSGGGTWGSITGTLSDQSDLGTALAAKLDATSTLVPMWHKYTVAYTSLTAASTTQQVTLFTLPANGDIEGIRIKHSTAFAGPSITAMTVSIGSSTNTTGYAPAFNIFQAVSATTMYSDGGSFALTSASHGVVAAFTATGANLGNGTTTSLTAGSVDIYVLDSVLP